MTFSANPAPTFLKQPRKGLVQIANADTTTQKTVVTAGANGSKLMALYASSTDTSNRDVQVSIVRSSTTYILGVTTVPAASGSAAATPPVDLLANLPASMLAVDNDGQHYLFLESGDTLVVNSLVTVTSGKIISAHADYGDY